MSRRVLVVDDNFEMAKVLAESVSERGFEGVPIESGIAAIELVRSEPFAAVVTDLRIPDADGMQVLASSKAAFPDRPVLIMTAFSAVDTAIEAIKAGAYHYLTKPFRREELIIFLERALDDAGVRREANALRQTLHEQFSLGAVTTVSPGMRAALEIASRVAKTASPILITGETGTGKSAVAQAIHAESKRAGAFVSINCAALPENLLESELFGQAKGAFTGADVTRAGLFAEADGGTLLLDEIGDMALGVQGKLLHVLERGVVRPLGATKERAVDVRIIAATDRDLFELSQNGGFRKDLLFRLDVVAIELPPLVERREDVLPLAARFIDEARERHPSSPVRTFAPAAARALTSYRWPGNVREMKHLIERLVLLGQHAVIEDADLPSQFLVPATAAPSFGGQVIPVRRLQRLYARWALEQLGGFRRRTALQLGVDVKTLAKWLGADDDAEQA